MKQARPVAMRHVKVVRLVLVQRGDVPAFILSRA
jgi:hypothetical protein